MKRLRPFQDMYFASGLDPEEAPFIIERLRGTPLRVATLIEGLPVAQLEAKPPEEWSVLEHLDHLVAADREFSGRIRKYLDRADVLDIDPAGDIPPGTGDSSSGHNSVQLLDGFRETRRGLLAQVEHLDGVTYGHQIYFPLLDRKVSLVDKLFFIAQHDDSHVAWLWRLSQGLV